MKKTVTIRTLQSMKDKGERITMLTAYDATFARLLDEAGIDVLLVGDSLGMVVQGKDNTLEVTVEEIAYHTRAVARGADRAHIVGDMPFLSWQTSAKDALENAGKLLKAGAHSVKLEGGVEAAETVAALVRAGIPVMGHVGLTPQSVHAMGGFRVQGKNESDADRILRDARALEEAGAYSIVLEGIPTELAARITESLTIPTIGIGAGNVCDGQVLVIYDLLGLDPSFKPKFVKRYADGAGTVLDAAKSYVDEVRSGAFPDAEHSFGKASKKPEPAPAPPRAVYGPVDDDDQPIAAACSTGPSWADVDAWPEGDPQLIV
jgi:3-methyl-2-oxobutanoate hydroxymethyltransferase